MNDGTGRSRKLPGEIKPIINVCLFNITCYTIKRLHLLVFSSLFVLVVMSPDEWLKKITIMPYNYGLKYTHTGKNELKLWLTEIHLVWLSMVMTVMFPNGQNRKKMNRWSQQF